MSRRPHGAAFLVLPAAAFLWGFAESVWVFVVADILVSYAALRYGLRTGLLAGLLAALAAPFGGAWLYHLAATDPSAATAWLASVPFVSPGLIERGMATMASPDWPLGMLAGSVTGVPYKIFAAGAGAHAVPLAAFLAASVPLRLFRYVAATLAVCLADRLVSERISARGKLMLLAAFWILFYGQFWFRMSL